MANVLERRLTREDNIWRHSEVAPYNNSPVIAVDFENELSEADARQMFDRVCRNLRFRKILEDRGAWRMPEFSDLDVQYEEVVRFHEVPLSAGIEAQNEFLSELFDKICNEKFDRPGPLWSIDVGNRGPGAGAMVFIKVHHCLGDGTSLGVYLLTHLVDGGECVKEELTQTVTSLLEKRQRASFWTQAWAVLMFIWTYLFGMLTQLRNLRPDEGVPSVTRGNEKVDRETLEEVVCTGEGSKLGDLKGACVQLDCTLNQLFVASLGGALRRYLEEGGYSPRRRLHVALAVSERRRMPDSDQVSNQIGFPSFSIGTHVEDLEERVRHVQRKQWSLKHRGHSAFTRSGLSLLGGLPRPVGRPIFEFLSGAASIGISNVRGPSEAISIFGNQVTRLRLSVPPGAKVGLCLSFLSYNGRVEVSATSAELTRSDLGRIISGIEREFAEAVNRTD